MEGLGSAIGDFISGITGNSKAQQQQITEYKIVIGVLAVAIFVIIMVLVFRKNNNSNSSQVQNPPQYPQQPPQPPPQQPQYPQQMNPYPQGQNQMPNQNPVYPQQNNYIQPNQAMPRSIQLYGESGVYRGQRFSITSSAIFGRNTNTANIIFPKDTVGVSGVHCKIYLMGNQIQIMDLNSKFGTFVNYEKLQPQVPRNLNPGDLIYLGYKENSFRVG